jgi:folate-dependent phosphoribosylglycinamide formyltransferase PurN
MLKVALLAPIHNSLYARLVVRQLVDMEDVEICAILVRDHINLQRFKSEFGRDGARLIRKIAQKYVLGDKRFENNTNETLASLAVELGLQQSSLKDFAALYDLPYMRAANHNQPKSERFLQETQPDVIVFTGGGLIRKNILAIPKIGILNCHTGILPQYRGMDVVEWTAAEDKMDTVGFGATLHLMDKGVDTGPILLKRTIPAKTGDNFTTIRERLEVLMVRLMVEGIAGLRDNKLQPQPQAPQDGRQYFVMHPRMKAFACRQLDRELKS